MNLNNKILKILKYCPRENRVTDVHENYNITSPHKFNILLFVYKYLHHADQLPSAFRSYYLKNSQIHIHNTPFKNEPCIELFSSSIGQRCIKYKESHL